MKYLYCSLILIIRPLFASGDEVSIDFNTFAHQYFEAFVASQAPEATPQDIENYLALLKDDIAHTHLPWQTEDTRLPDGKDVMRKGMTYYLGNHTTYQAELLNVFTFNDSAIAIRYRDHVKGVHPQTKQEVEHTQIIMEVLEMEDGKVAVIRKYHE